MRTPISVSEPAPETVQAHCCVPHVPTPLPVLTSPRRATQTRHPKKTHRHNRNTPTRELTCRATAALTKSRRITESFQPTKGRSPLLQHQTPSTTQVVKRCRHINTMFTHTQPCSPFQLLTIACAITTLGISCMRTLTSCTERFIILIAEWHSCQRLPPRMTASCPC